ncbi:hypothetical protein H9P43_005726 [Blastocladiella emersonii ATCC 22665]|nr:hypothetical protein H9P43_005726 [Blastocladiella emersonii ATCC 22665]
MKIGVGLTAFGSLFLLLGVLLFFDGGLLAIGNILFLGGVTMLIGLSKTVAFFARKNKLRGTICFFAGVLMVFLRMPLLGMIVEVFGFINLFGDFFPVVVAFLRRMPLIGPLLSAPGVTHRLTLRAKGDESARKAEPVVEAVDPTPVSRDPIIEPLRPAAARRSSKPQFKLPPAVAAVAKPKQPAEPLSKRKQFMAVRFYPSTMQRIRDLGLGEGKWPREKPEDFEFIGSARSAPLTFVAAATKAESFWPNTEKLPELGVIGRSNVGKSRLLNAVFASTVVRVKNKPGLTQSINWFRAAPPLRALIVDMPGYGFAYAKQEKAESWDALIGEFLARPSVHRVLVLVDARHGVKVNDAEFLEKHLAAVPHVGVTVVMTKCDLVQPEILARRHRLVCEDVARFGVKPDDVVMVSSKSGAGIVALREMLVKAAE